MSLIARADDQFQNADGTLKLDVPDGWIVGWKELAAAAGFRDARYFEGRALADGFRSLMHLVIQDVCEARTVLARVPMSAPSSVAVARQAIAELRRSEQAQRGQMSQLVWLHRGGA